MSTEPKRYPCPEEHGQRAHPMNVAAVMVQIARKPLMTVDEIEYLHQAACLLEDYFNICTAEGKHGEKK